MPRWPPRVQMLWRLEMETNVFEVKGMQIYECVLLRRSISWGNTIQALINPQIYKVRSVTHPKRNVFIHLWYIFATQLQTFPLLCAIVVCCRDNHRFRFGSGLWIMVNPLDLLERIHSCLVFLFKNHVQPNKTRNTAAKHYCMHVKNTIRTSEPSWPQQRPIDGTISALQRSLFRINALKMSSFVNCVRKCFTSFWQTENKVHKHPLHTLLKNVADCVAGGAAC